MEDQQETRDQLILELETLKARVSELESSESEWRRIAEKCEAQGRLLLVTTNSLPVLMSYIDSEQRYRFCSKTYEQWFGVPFEKIEGRPMREVLGDTIYNEIKPHIETALTGNPVSYDVTLKYGDGNTREVSVVYYPHWENDSVEGMAVLVHDQTERNAAVRKFAEANEFSEKVLSTSPVGICTFRSDGQCVLANDAMALIVGGQEKGQILLQNYRLLESWKTSGLLDEAEAVMSSGIERRREVHMVSTFGKDLWLDCRLSRFTSGNEHHLLLIAEDVSAQKKAHNEIRSAHEELERRVEDQTRELILANEQLKEEIAERKRVEEALRESHTMMKSILATSPVGIGLTEDRIMRWANEAWKKMFGFENEQDYVGRNARMLYPSDEEYDRIGELHRKSLETGEVASGDSTFMRVDGSLFDGNIRLKTFGPSGPTRGTIAAISDISERKYAEQALKESERRYRALADNSLTGICVHQDGTFVYVNDRFSEMVGYAKDELIGASAYEIIIPEDRDLVEGRARARLSGFYVPPQYEFRVLTKNGQVKWLEMWSTVISNNGSRAILANLVDITERKQVEKSLSESEAKFRLLVNDAPVGILLVARDGKILDVNKKLVEILGSPSPEATKELNMLTFPLLVKAGISGLVKRCMEEGRQISSELPYTSKWGKNIFLRTILTPILDSTGNVTGCQALMEDFTPRKEAEMSLAESERKLRDIVEHSTNLFYSHTPDHKLTYLSSQTRQFFDCEPHEAMTEWTNLVSDNPINKEGLEHTNRAIMTGQVQPPYELELTGTKGRIVWAEVHESPVVVDGKVIAIVGSLTNITRRKKSELARRRLATAVEQAAEAVVITSPQGIIEYVNPSFERMSGFSRKEVLGQPTSLLQDYENDPSLYDELQNTLANGRNWSGHLSNRRKDGTIYQEDLTISPVRDSYGKITNFVAIKRDISQEIALQRQLLQAQKMEAIGTLAGGIAHDFNNLLQVTMGFSEILLQDKEESNPEFADLQKIIQAARNGADLVQRLLTFSRKVEPNPTPVRLNHHIRQLGKMLGRTIPKMINIELNLADDLDMINADPTQVEQIIMNLAINARDAMPDGGTLSLETRNVALDAVFCQKHPGAMPGEFVMFHISDTGHGMDADTLQHLFEPFFTTKELGRGTGLGLAVVYGIVEQHGGYIACESQPGLGTSFRIYLPAMRIEKGPDSEKIAIMPAVGTETILLVDDEEFVRDLAERILGKAGYTVLTASNGREALEMFRKQKQEISLVILDLIMPEMGGKQCLWELMKINPDLKVSRDKRILRRGTFPTSC